MKKFLIAGIAAILFYGTAAFSADMPVKGQTVDPEYNWSGTYFGGDLGWARNSDHWTFVNPAPAACCVPFSASKDNLALGVHAGAQMQWNHIVLGVEGGVYGFPTDKWAEGPVCVTGGNNCFVRPDPIYTLGGRAGFAWGNLLLYGDGGGAWAKVNSRQTAANGVSAFDTASADRAGWYAGGGVDWLVIRGPLDVILGLEYKHIDLGTGLQASSADGGACGINCRSISSKEDLALLRLTFKK
jgi:outer membrane immunogenic protein